MRIRCPAALGMLHCTVKRVGFRLIDGKHFLLAQNCLGVGKWCCLLILLTTLLYARQKQTYGEGFSIDFPRPEKEVLQAVEEVVQNGIIRGTKEYNKDQAVEGAESAQSSRLFPPWTGPGKVFYKVRKQALDPRNFKDSNDVGTLAVRYVVQGQDPARTTLRIDAVFVEDFRHRAHPSNGSVELGEFEDIQDHLKQIDLLKKQAIEDENKKRQELAKKEVLAKEDNRAAHTISARSSAESLEQRVHELRRQVEQLVKPPGAALKSAPFQSATTLKSLPPGSEVVVLISTPYWYGVETAEGQRGWISRQQLEPLP